MAPLPSRPSTAPPLIGKADGQFNTSAAAAWPPQMCAGIAKSIMNDIDTDSLRDNKEPLRVLTSSAGGAGSTAYAQSCSA